MKAVWSTWALERMDEIHTYLEQEAGIQVARRTISKITDAVLLLTQFPRGGQIEPWLEHKGLDHRRAVVGNYKVVYRIDKQEIKIIDVFDARQDPKKMKG